MNLRDLIFHAEYQLHRDRGFDPADARAAALTIADKLEPASPLSSAIGMAQALHDLSAAGVSPDMIAKQLVNDIDYYVGALARHGWTEADLVAAVNSLPRPASTVTVSGPASAALGFNVEAPEDPAEPEWIVNDIGELGVVVSGRAYFLYKGRSLSYDEDGLHDDGTPMLIRPVGKREFGECCHPVRWYDDGHSSRERYTLGDGWQPLPQRSTTNVVERHDDTVQYGETLYSTRQAIADAGLPVTLSAAEAVRQLAAERDSLRRTLASVQRERDGLAQAYAVAKENEA